MSRKTTAGCGGVAIKTLMWKPMKRRIFETVGFVDLSGNVYMKFEPFPNTKYGYNGRQFQVSTILVGTV